MIETIELRVTSPKVEIPGLDAAIVSLKELKAIYDMLAKLPPLAIQGFSGVAGSMRQMTDYGKLLLKTAQDTGNVDIAASWTRGFKTLGVEVTEIDQKLAQLRTYAAGAPPPGSPLRVGNPALDKKLSENENMQAALHLRRQEITSLPSDINAQAMMEAEKNVAAGSTAATTALSEQGKVVTTKAGQMGSLSGALGTFTQAERAATAATGDGVLISEKYITAKGKTALASQTFAADIGVTRTKLGEEGEKVIENTNFLEQYKNALRANSAEFANRRVVVGRGTAEEAQLLRNEAAAMNNVTRSFGQFVGQADQQRATTRAAALERRANLIDAQNEQKRAAELDARRVETIKKIRDLENQRTTSSANVQRFEQLRPGFPESETRKSVLPTGETVQRTTLSRQTEGLRESATLTERFDATGKRLNATLDETAKKMQASFGSTTQGTLLATIGMAAKFIAIYRGIDLLIRGFEFGVESAAKFERQVATLSIIFHGTAEESHNLGVQALTLAANLGQIGTDAHEVAIEFARFGLRQAEVLEAMRVAMVGANVAQLDLGESGKFLQAIYAGYQLQVGQLSGVLGSLDTVSHSYNVTNKQLLEGLSRVAPLAKQAGISLQELIGFEAAITGRTARPGAEAGTAIKSLISRLSKPATQEALQDIAGVSVTAQSGDLKSASQIIGELYVAYQNLSRAEQQELLVKVAGTQQASRIAALLDGYLKSQELAIKASLDQGRAERENVAIRTTLSSQLKTLTTEWQKFWIASGQGAGGLQSQLTEIVKALSSVIDQLAEAELRAGRVTPRRSVEQLKADEIKKEIKETGPVFPFDLGRVARLGNLERQLALLDRQKKGALDAADAEKVAGDELIRFGAELGKIQGEATAFERTEATLQKIAKLLPQATPERRTGFIQSAAAVAAPFDQRRQLQIREELTNMAKLNDFGAINVRIQQLIAEASNKRTDAVGRLNAMLDKEGERIDKGVELEKQRRDESAKAGKGDEADRAQHLIETYENYRAKLSELRGQATSLALAPDLEEPFTLDLGKAREEQKAAAAAQAEGIKAVFKTITAPISEVDKLDREILSTEAQINNIEQQRTALKRDIAGMTEAERIARREVLGEALEAVKAEQDHLNILRQYAGEQDAILKRQRDLKDAFDGIKNIFDAFPKFELFGAGGTSAVADLNRQMSELLEKSREVGRQQADTAEAYQAQTPDTILPPGLRPEDLLKAPVQIPFAIPEPTQDEEEALRTKQASVDARDHNLGLVNLEAEAQRSVLQIEKDKLDTLRRYAELQDEIARGARQGKIESEQFRIGRNDTEQLVTEATGIQRQLLPQAFERINLAGGNKSELARGQAEAAELVNRLTNIQISLDERRYRLAADIANERQKENEEASKSLQLASREEQLRAAFVARFVQNRGGRGFSANEFQFLDQDTRQSISRFQPTALPDSVPTRSRELEREQRQLTAVFDQLTKTIESTVKNVQSRVEGNQVTPGERRVDASKLPGAINLPAVNIDVKDQFAQLTRYLGDVVISRFETELSAIHSEVSSFINKQRINAAQSAATGAT